MIKMDYHTEIVKIQYRYFIRLEESQPDFSIQSLLKNSD